MRLRLASTPACHKRGGADGRKGTPHREPTSIRGERGQYYRVYFVDAVLIDDTWNPEFEACRAFVARGVTGWLETWRVGKTHPDMIVPDIEEGARWKNDK